MPLYCADEREECRLADGGWSFCVLCVSLILSEHIVSVWPRFRNEVIVTFHLATMRVVIFPTRSDVVAVAAKEVLARVQSHMPSLRTLPSLHFCMCSLLGLLGMTTRKHPLRAQC